MQNNANSPDFQTSNPFSEHFTKFGKTRLFDRLQQKFTPKPYFYKFKTLRLVVLGASFLFHILSAATAAALIFLFVGKLIPNAMFAGAVTLAALVGLELAKRETSGRFFHDALQFGKMSPGLGVVVLGLSAVSIACSYFGAERAVREFTPPPALINADTLTAPIRGQLAAIDGQIADAKKNTWKGKVTTRAQRTIDRLTRQKDLLVSEFVRQQSRADQRNDATETAHTATTEANASGFALFTLCSELLLIVCLWYLQFYDFRSFAEYCAKPTPAKIASIGFQDLHTAAQPPAFSHNGNGTTSPNGAPHNEAPRRPIGFLHYDENRQTKIVDGANTRTCDHCGKSYTYRHHKQKYCSDQCRMTAWETRTGTVLKRGKPATNTA